MITLTAFLILLKPQQTIHPTILIHVNNVESVLEIALAGFGKKELKVYTEYGKLVVEGQKETNKETGSEYVHQGLDQRSFTREWALSDDVEVREVQFKDGLLTVKLGKIVPEHHARKNYLSLMVDIKGTISLEIIGGFEMFKVPRGYEEPHFSFGSRRKDPCMSQRLHTWDLVAKIM